MHTGKHLPRWQQLCVWRYGTESFDISGLAPLNNGEMVPLVQVTATRSSGEVVHFAVRLRIDTPTEADYYRHGGVLNYVLRQLAPN